MRPKKRIEKDMLWDVEKYFLNRLNDGFDDILGVIKQLGEILHRNFNNVLIL